MAKQRFKNLSNTQTNSVREAFLQVQGDLQNNNPELVASFGSFDSLCSMGYRSQMKGLPPISANPAEQDIPLEFTRTQSGEQHLMYVGIYGEPPDVDEIDERLVAVVFSTRDEFIRCIRSRRVNMDGTFKTCPRPYKQFFSIHGYVGEKCVPLIKVIFYFMYSIIVI